MCPEAQLPPVHPGAPAVYQQELRALQQQRGGVSPRPHPQRSTLGGLREGGGPPSLCVELILGARTPEQTLLYTHVMREPHGVRFPL